MIFEIYAEENYRDSSLAYWNWRLKSKGNIVSNASGYNDVRSALKTLRSIFKESPIRLKEIEKAAKKIGYTIDGHVIKNEKINK